MMEQFDFSAQPKMVRQKKKYAADQPAVQATLLPDEEYDARFHYQNLMFEPRVVRGNTYSAYVVSKEDEMLYKASQKQPTRRVVQNGNIDAKLQNSFNQTSEADTSMTSTVKPPPGKAFAGCFTEEQLLYETDLPAIHDFSAMTEFIIEKEIPDLSMPVYKGIHKETQIYPGEPPFDFNYEAEPIVQVLMTRILEESRIEVLEEKELEAMKKRQEYLLAYKAETKRKLNALEERERQAVRNNNEKKKTEHDKKSTAISTHKHLVARVFSKSFLRDVTKSSLEILDNQGVFVDIEEKSVRDEVMPWLYTQVFNNLQKYQQIEKFVDKQIDMVSHNNRSSHHSVVLKELERRRLEKKEQERQIFERNERRRLKLEMKLRRREHRRLHNLEKSFVELYMPTADIDKELINVSDLDGSDSNGMKSTGFRGGLLGEIYLLLKKLQGLDIYSKVSAEWEGYPLLLQTFWDKFVGDGWSVAIGLDPAFDTNAGRRVEGALLEKLDLDFIRGLSPEEFKIVATQIKAHYVNRYLDETFPGLPERRAKKINKVKFVEPTETEEKKNDDEDQEKQASPVSSPPKKKKKKRLIPVESEAPAPGSSPVSHEPRHTKSKKTEAHAEEVDPDPLYQELDKFISKTLDILLDEKYGIRNVKFTKYSPKVFEEKKAEDGAGEDGQPVAVPRVLALFVPERPPEGDTSSPLFAADDKTMSQGKPGATPGSPNQPGVKAMPGTVVASPTGKGVSVIPPSKDTPPPEEEPEVAEDDEENQEKKPAVVELLPYMPRPEDIWQDFEGQVSNLDLNKRDFDVAMVHLPLLKQLTKQFIMAVVNQTSKEDPERVFELSRKFYLQDIEELKALAKKSKRDLLFINSY